MPEIAAQAQFTPAHDLSIPAGPEVVFAQDEYVDGAGALSGFQDAAGTF